MMRDQFTETERARSALWSLDSGCDPAEHFKLAAAAFDAGIEFDEFNRWSATAHNYGSEGACLSTWKSASKPGAVKAATLFKLARDAGWSDDAESRPERPQSRQNERKQPEPSKTPLHDPRTLWDACKPVAASHGYINRRLGLADGLRVYSGSMSIAAQPLDGSLVLPCRTLAGDLVSLQFIPPGENAKKVFLPGCKLPTDACLIIGGPIRDDKPVFILEGIGQAWSTYQASTAPAVVCFGSARMAGVAKALRAHHKAAKLVLVADGGKEAQMAAIAKDIHGAWVEMPSGSPSNYDLNDYHKSHTLKEVADLLAQAKEHPARFNLAQRTADQLFKGEPPAVNWLVKGIFPLGVCCLLASPPNVGKSFLALDMAAKVAGRVAWDSPAYALGAQVAGHGRAIYVSAEDDEPEIHRRLWSLCDGRMPDRLHVLSLPDVGHFGIIESDRVTKEYKATDSWRDLCDEIKALSDVKLIVLDTLQALTTGDTNSTEATQPLMNEATALAAATGACVMLIHHVAKGSTREIRSSLDAMEAIRGSGAIAGTARAAYVLWPPADGGRAVCETLGTVYAEGKVAFGLVAKKYGDARRDRSVFVRDDRGILQDKTQEYNSAAGQDDSETLRGDLLHAIREKWDAGQAFAASHTPNGLHSRRFELPETFHEKPRTWFEEQAGKLLADGNIKRFPYKGGHRLVPMSADCAIPKPAPEDDQAPEVELDSEVLA